jgi:hypothetical protein
MKPNATSRSSFHREHQAMSLSRFGKGSASDNPPVHFKLGDVRIKPHSRNLQAFLSKGLRGNEWVNFGV